MAGGMGSRVVSVLPTGGGAAGGGVPGTPGLDLQNLIDQFTQGSGASNKASLRQFRNLMKSARRTKKDVMGLYPKMMGLTDTFGQSGMADIEQARMNERGGVLQDMVSRGLGNTTIRSTMLAGADQNALRAQQNLGESVNRQKLGILQDRAGMRLNLGNLMSNAIQSRENTGPDLSAYMAILQQLAASQAGR
jgi:hypothetical protein